jgi:polysaccharide biosynthesis protein PslG
VRSALLSLLLVLLAVAAAADAAPRRVPAGWLGVTADGPLTPAMGGEWNRMATNGVESVRLAIRWDVVQAGGPDALDLAGADAEIAAAAARGLRVLPVVQGTPAWSAPEPARPPADPDDYGRFLAALVARYGPQGSLWAERPDLPRIPVRAWQLWNEPNLTRYWTGKPFAGTFVRLLRAAHTALHAADPGATVVLAGLPNESWKALRRIYAAGGRGTFDAVALHPYTGQPADVLRLVRYARNVMRNAGDGRRPVWITELSWPAAKGGVPHPVGFETTDKGQARRLDAVMKLLVQNRRERKIARVFWYTWLSRERGPSAFDWSGLRRLRGGEVVSAPALAVFRRWARKLEGCAKAPGDALRCG